MAENLQEIIGRHRSDLNNLTTAAIREGVKYTSLNNNIKSAEEWVSGFIDTQAPYMYVSSKFSADSYNEIKAYSRATSGLRYDSYTATQLKTPETIGRAFGMGNIAYQRTQEFGVETALPFVGNTIQKAIFSTSRENMSLNMFNDRTPGSMSTIPRFNACDWCMLISGNPYQGFFKYHDYCRCVAAPLFTGVKQSSMMPAATMKKVVGFLK